MNTINNKNNMLDSLATWIEELMKAAKEDEFFSVKWFGETRNEPFNIVGGWSEGFSEEYDDLIFISKSEPNYAMCVKIVVNDGQYCPDFETLNMPIDADGYVDDTCVALELEDDPMSTAKFFLNEWERITKEHEVA